MYKKETLYTMPKNARSSWVFRPEKQVSMCHFTQFYKVRNFFIETPFPFMYNWAIRVSFGIHSRKE